MLGALGHHLPCWATIASKGKVPSNGVAAKHHWAFEGQGRVKWGSCQTPLGMLGDEIHVALSQLLLLAGPVQISNTLSLVWLGPLPFRSGR
jgi:hypothetical protein